MGRVDINGIFQKYWRTIAFVTLSTSCIFADWYHTQQWKKTAKIANN